MSAQIHPKDDLKLIDGIGPGLEARLNAHGIYTYTQLSKLSAKEIALTLGNLAGLNVRKIEHYDWAGQALKLAEANPTQLIDDVPEKTREIHSPCATFTVELLLNKDNQVRGMIVTHHQTKLEHKWAGWNLDGLTEFMVTAGELSLPDSVLDSPAENPSLTESSGVLSAFRLFPKAPGSQEPCHVLGANQLFDVELMLDASALKLPNWREIVFSADMYARRLAGHSRTLLGQVQGSANQFQSVQLCLQNLRLATGMYRLEAVLGIVNESLESDPQFIRLSLQGDLLQVYPTEVIPKAHQN